MASAAPPIEYRRTNRGGQGITNIDNLARNGPVVASFPAHNGEQLMLVTDQAKLIRMSVGDTRVIGRNSAGVRLFNVAENEHVVSAARIEESEEEDEAAIEGDADSGLAIACRHARRSCPRACAAEQSSESKRRARHLQRISWNRRVLS